MLYSERMASNKRTLKTSKHIARSANVWNMAFEHRGEQQPVFEFYDDEGRRHLVLMGQRQATILAQRIQDLRWKS